MSEEQGALPGDPGQIRPALALAGAFETSRGRARDLLADPADLRRWLDRHGLHPGALPVASPVRRLLHEEIVRLRAAIRAALSAFSDSRPIPEPALHDLNRVLAFGASTHRLEGHAGEYRLRAVETGEDPRALLVPIALDAAALLQAADPRRTRECAAEGCRRWFVDTSKAGRRRWCSMALCGNRAKAARHRERSAPDA